MILILWVLSTNFCCILKKLSSASQFILKLWYDFNIPINRYNKAIMKLFKKIMDFFNGNNFKNTIYINVHNMSNQPLTSKEFKFSNLTSAINRTTFNVVLNNNPSNSSDFATLEAQEDQINRIHLTEKNGTLSITCDNGSYSNVKINLNARNLNKFINSSCGNLDGNFIGASLEFEHSGTGDVSLNGKADFINISNNSAGNFTGEFDSKKLRIENSGTGDIIFNGSAVSACFENSSAGNFTANFTDDLATESITIENSGTGDIVINGSASSVEIENSSAGNFIGKLVANSFNIENCGTGDIKVIGSATSIKMENTSAGEIDLSKLKAEKIEFYASGTGDVEIFATKEISGKSTGVGDVTYGGIKAVFIQNTGVGSVIYRG